MRARIATLVIVLIAAITVPASASTIQGNVPPGGFKAYGVANLGSGQVIFTLTWAKKPVDLDLLLDCDGFPWGISASLEERSERLEVGLFPGQTCTVGVASFSGGSRFWLNIQSTAGGSAPLAPGTESLRIHRVSPSEFPGLVQSAEVVAAVKH